MAKLQAEMRQPLRRPAPGLGRGIVHVRPGTPRTFGRSVGRRGGRVGGTPRGAGLSHYLTLGHSGLRVSPLCLGTMTFGEDWGWGSTVAESEAILDRYLDRGGNFIDTANGYTKGHSEVIIGDYFARTPGRPHRPVIATKVLTNLYRCDPNGGGAVRKSGGAACYQSLGPPGTDTLALDGYAGKLQGDYRVRRAINFSLLSGVALDTVADASIDADRRLAGLGLTWALPSGAWEWQLGAGLDWQRTNLDAYAESGGSGLALRVPARAITSRRGRLDAALARNVSASWGVLVPTSVSSSEIRWATSIARASSPLARAARAELS